MMNFVSISAVSISIPFQLLEVSLDKKKSIVKEVWICAQFEINRSPFFALFVSSSFSAGLLMSENILHHAVSWTQLFLFSYAHECCTLLFSLIHFLHFWKDVVYINVIYGFKALTRYAFVLKDRLA